MRAQPCGGVLHRNVLCIASSRPRATPFRAILEHFERQGALPPRAAPAGVAANRRADSAERTIEAPIRQEKSARSKVELNEYANAEHYYDVQGPAGALAAIVAADGGKFKHGSYCG